MTHDEMIAWLDKFLIHNKSRLAELGGAKLPALSRIYRDEVAALESIRAALVRQDAMTEEWK